MADKEYQRMLLASGFEAELDSSPDKTRRFVEDEIARWTPIIRSIGLKLD
jgi:tripartite-type tricarboxylate transporter receptor subunit TctC